MTEVGPYRILRKVRQGGQGSVFLGYDGRLQRRVAIKIYTQPGDRKRSRALLREARLVAGIQSPRVVQVHDVITSRHHLALVMEYVPGTDLEQFLTHVRPSVSSVICASADIAAALAAARQQRVVHGDLKAGNVLISTGGRVKLTDFGIARDQGVGPGRTGIPGSHSAVSPEQYLGEPLDVRSDLFALGCLMYRMLTGRHPFYRRGRLDEIMLLEGSPPVLEEQLPAATELPEGLADLVRSLLRKDPRDRPGNTHQVRQVLRSVTREVPLSAGNPLAREAAPWFRAESSAELPPQVPAELGLEGRSRLRPAGGMRGWTWRNPLARPRLAVLAGMLVLATAAAAGLAYRQLWGLPVRIHIDAPVLAIASAARLPEGLSGAWLVAEFTSSVSSHLGPLLVTGPVGASAITTLYTRGRSPAALAPRERYTIGLRCSADFCLLGLSRERDGRRYAGRAILLPEASLPQWRAAVRQSAGALFSEPGW